MPRSLKANNSVLSVSPIKSHLTSHFFILKDKTISPYQKTKLYQSKDEGLFVVKQLLKCETAAQFEQLRDKIQI